MTHNPTLNRSPVGRPIHVPDDWADQALLTFDQFCQLSQLPPRTVRDWRRRHIGPHFHKLPDTGRLYITVAETRRFLHSGNHPTPASTTTTTTPTTSTATSTENER